MDTSDIVKRAAKFAEMAHAGQTRKGNDEPFFNHPMRVAEMTRAVGHPNEVVAAAYLHDVLEDTEHKIGHFPGRVQEIVERLTKRESEPKIDHVLRIGRSMDRAAILIKCADRIDNIKDGATVFGPAWMRRYVEHSTELVRLAQDNGLGEYSLVLLLEIELMARKVVAL